MFFYQPYAYGRRKSFEDSMGTIISKKIFRTIEAAAAYQDEFKAKCCGDGLMDLDPTSAVVSINQLEIQD